MTQDKEPVTPLAQVTFDLCEPKQPRPLRRSQSLVEESPSNVNKAKKGNGSEIYRKLRAEQESDKKENKMRVLRKRKRRDGNIFKPQLPKSKTNIVEKICKSASKQTADKPSTKNSPTTPKKVYYETPQTTPESAYLNEDSQERYKASVGKKKRNTASSKEDKYTRKLISPETKLLIGTSVVSCLYGAVSRALEVYKESH